ncbi:MAG: GyrI-like domain-containing protein, partial [Anaerolineae bacterium]|nr:GyrI-like domain-containing protein [Anaerolineae bacterium]
DMAAFSMEHREQWRWTSMIMQPPPVTAEWVSRATEEVKRKKNPAALSLLHFETYQEGLAAQVLHIGPYAAEAPTIQKLHAYIHERGYKLRGKHHEIYLGDPRRTAPENLKTIIRQPIQK